MNKATQKVIDGLTSAQVAEVSAGLIRKAREETSYIAVPFGSAFEAQLRVLGMKDEADAVRAIVNAVLKRRF